MTVCKKILLSSIVAVLAYGCDATQPNPDPSPAPSRFEPEPVSSFAVSASDKSFLAKDYVAVTANPHATRAAVEVLASGGSAVDAAIAAQMVLGLVEPQSSGLGGGGFLVHWDNQAKKLNTYDGRETAPSQADESLFLQEDGQSPMSFFKAIVGGRSVGVPGMVDMLAIAHQEHGALEWSLLFEHAIALAENGFEVSPRLHQLIANVPAVNARPDISSYLFDEHGKPLEEGALLKNSRYAKSLESIAKEGAKGLYSGDVAKAMANVVVNDANAGKLSLQDLENYEAKPRDAVCGWVFEYKLCGMAPPSSGPVTVIATLKMMESALKARVMEDVKSLSDSALLSHLFIEASRLAFADRNTYLADPDFVDVPVNALLDAGYLESRAQQINLDEALVEVSPGQLLNRQAASWKYAPSLERASTTHLSIVDGSGNMVSMTTSIEMAFGSRLMAGGYILNNQLTDFSFIPETEEKQLVANRVQAGKRPLSSMAPMMVFDKDDNPILAIGSPGGKSIIPYVSRTLFEVLALGQSLEEAVNGSHIIHTGRSLVLEEGVSQSLVDDLKEKGHSPQIKAQASGLHAIQRDKNGWLGVADRRREGVALGK